MEAENINSDDILPPSVSKKASKRPSDCNVAMQVDEESPLKDTKHRLQAPRAKRLRSDIRKISVPPHRYYHLLRYYLIQT